MIRDAIVRFRVPGHVKQAWLEVAKEEDISLTTLIEHAMDAYLENRKPSFTEYLATSHAEVAEQADAPASRSGEETREGSTPSLGTQMTVPGSDPRVCPNAAHHRKGVYCKGCRKVIQKG